MYHVELQSGNKTKRGQRIPGYYIIYPALDHLGNMVFWRDDTLMVIDKDRKLSKILAIEPTERVWTSPRILLHETGKVIFSINQSLFVLETNLGKLAESTWPCNYANNQRNPVIQ